MKNTTNSIENYEMYRKIAELGMTPFARDRAYSTLKKAESWINALQWLVARPLGNSFKPTNTTKLKHQ